MNKNFFLRTLHFHSALAILEPQIYGVVEHFLAENIPLLSGRLVSLVKFLLRRKWLLNFRKFLCTAF